MNLEELWTTIHENSPNHPISTKFLQNACMVVYNSLIWVFAYLQRLSKYSQNAIFNYFSSFFRILLLEYFMDLVVRYDLSAQPVIITQYVTHVSLIRRILIFLHLCWRIIRSIRRYVLFTASLDRMSLIL